MFTLQPREERAAEDLSGRAGRVCPGEQFEKCGASGVAAGLPTGAGDAAGIHKLAIPVVQQGLARGRDTEAHRLVAVVVANHRDTRDPGRLIEGAGLLPGRCNAARSDEHDEGPGPPWSARQQLRQFANARAGAVTSGVRQHDQRRSGGISRQRTASGPAAGCVGRRPGRIVVRHQPREPGADRREPHDQDGPQHSLTATVDDDPQRAPGGVRARARAPPCGVACRSSLVPC